MKQFLGKLVGLATVWLGLLSFSAAGQTADEYVRPYAEPFQYGSNLGYYGEAWKDESLAGLVQKLGGHSIRPTLPDFFVEVYGYDIRASTFDTYVNKLGMKELTCFIEKPSDAHSDPTRFAGCDRHSQLFGHLYEPIWNPDGTVNTNNYYANYVYKLLQNYGDKVRFWEVVNEPDFSYAYDKSQWLTRAPTPPEQTNTQAPFFYYIRMLRITTEVVRKYRPDSFVTTGGVGYSEYVDALLRYTDNPDGGQVTAQYPRTGGAYFDVLSFHSYPSYALHYWDGSINGFRYTRTSDYAANRIIAFKQEMMGVLAKYGYDGTKHPAKHLLMTEANIARRTSEDRTGSDEMQRNFGIKNLVLLQKNDIKQFYYYTVGEGVDAPPAGQSVSGDDEINLMGLYENLNRAVPGTARPTQFGQGFATTSKLLYGYQYDAARTAALALPAAIDGGAFSKNGQYVYVLWAKALVDNQEQASANYSFPAAWNVSTVQRYEWDYSVTTTISTQRAQNLGLTSAPSFFVTGNNPVVTAPAPAPAPTAPTPAPAPTPTTTACSATGSILREQWNNVPGTSVGNTPYLATPSSTNTLNQFELLGNPDVNYGARLRGYLCPPQSGAYTFFITGDDEVELWLSTDDNHLNRVRIASCSGWLASNHDWTRYPGQQSSPVQLTAGKRYYIEALHKQGWGPGYVSVAWKMPDGTLEGPIAGSHLSPSGAAATASPNTISTSTTTSATACSATGTLLREQWNNVSGNTVASIPAATAPASSSSLTQFEAPAGQGTNYGARLRGYLCPPQSGAYTFFIAGDDEVELWLSTNDNPANKVRIASCNSWLSSSHDFQRYGSQQSGAINLVAGQRYYIEALHKQGWGSDYVAVAWKLPNGTLEGPIPGSRLSPFVTGTGAANKGTANSLVGNQAATDEASSQAAATALTAYPNPFSRQATVQFSLAATGRASLSVYDVRGQLVRQLFSGQSPAGTSPRFTLDAQGLSQGVYVLRLVTDTKVLTQKLVLDK